MSNVYLDTDDFEELAAEILTGGNNLRFRARGSSMRPFIYDGDILEIKPEHGGSIRQADIVLCKIPSGHIVAHRVVKKEQHDSGDVLLLQGDALYNPDGIIRSNEVLGVVVSVERNKRITRLDTPIKRILAQLWIVAVPILRQIHMRAVTIKHKFTGK
jgi:signal peptidase I